VGGNFRGACHFWGDPYLNSTTVLFDKPQKLSLANQFANQLIFGKVTARSIKKEIWQVNFLDLPNLNCTKLSHLQVLF